MKYKTVILILIIGLFGTCNSAKYITVKHIKPVNRNSFFNKKKDNRKKRVKYVKVKILRQSKPEKAPKPQKSATEKQKNEADSTGTSN